MWIAEVLAVVGFILKIFQLQDNSEAERSSDKDVITAINCA